MDFTRFMAAGTAAVLALAPLAARAVPGLNEHVVADPATGVALFGYDPVAYFTDGRPTPGSRLIEAEWAGSAWRFSNEANRAAFLSAPEVYAPRYGGYDPLSVAKGFAAAGHPLLFVIRGDRLYLFRTAADRDAFSGPGEADRAWPVVDAGLTD